MINLIKDYIKAFPINNKISRDKKDEDYLSLSIIVEDISRSNGHVSSEGYELDSELCNKARALQWHLIQFIMYVDDNKIIEKINE